MNGAGEPREQATKEKGEVRAESDAHRIARLESEVAALEELLEVHERTVTEQSQRLESTLEQLDERARELERSNRELEMFAYVASHDLQEPLRMIASYTELLERRYADQLDDRARKYIHYAVDGATRMKSLIQGLLEYSRVETRAAEPETVALDDVVDAVLADLDLAIRESGATIERSPLPTITADRLQMRQLLQNLIGNALKFAGAEPPRVEISAEAGPGGWIVRVRDHGIGIEPRFRDRVFQIFQRLHAQDEYEGTGIGLALCRRIVERHGGTIQAGQPDEGSGTVFTFTLPKGAVIE